jgi:hypothetical protein
MTGPADLVRRAERALRLPDLTILGARIQPYVLVSSTGGYYDLSVSYTLDREDAAFALFVFLRDAGETEIAEAQAEQDPPEALPEAIRALGLPAQFDRMAVEDRTEADLTLYGSDLVLGIHVTATDPAATGAALDFAMLLILPQFLETP